MNENSFIARNHALNIDYIKGPKKERTLLQKIFDKIDDVGWYKDWTRLLPFGWRMRYYDKIRPIWNDQNKRVRKSIPRTWCDISHLMEIVNFEMVKTFYEKEYKAGIVDWESDDPHKEFAEWLEWAYNYITVERPIYEKTRDKSYPPLRLGPIESWFEPCEYTADGKVKMYKMKEREGTYEELYGEVNRMEALIEETDTKVLTGFVKYRAFFWT